MSVGAAWRGAAWVVARLIWGLVVFIPSLVWDHPGDLHDVWARLATDLFWYCGSGALIGLAFAAALSIGERRQLGGAAPRGSEG